MFMYTDTKIIVEYQCVRNTFYAKPKEEIEGTWYVCAN